jgi:hypothetical protein
MNVRFTSDDFSFPADSVVADYIAQRTTPDDTIFIWGFEPIVYWLSERGGPLPFVHIFPLRAGWSRGRYGAELAGKLREEPPDYFLIVRRDPLPWMLGTGDDSESAMRDYPQIKSWLDKNYQQETVIEDFLILKKRR